MGEIAEITWGDWSHLALLSPAPVPEMRSVGPVQYMFVHGRRDEGEVWGVIGAFWRTLDGEQGGFIVHPAALWAGSEMVRSYRGALQRGWTPDLTYTWWRRAGASGREHWVDPLQREAATLDKLSEALAER